ncbi:DUF4383 domain-containing protein [Paenibacillus sp. IB182496]|uniref:DUF4383 domain-containing protein n=1 Tax=Paenibacillus sabuli TaxID=2772509 RepID=A0A927BPE2_9BACL|nr:DUF4383 domain-containing protein [Paenibacillus sabuli]MBD2844287.1 DUF4383 domain-containing protein [Paenibacillus sabuli]
MAARRFAALVGIVFLFLGILGFFYSNLFGLFHLNTPQNVIHLVAGVLGLLASSYVGYAYRFAQVLGIVFLTLAVLGVLTRDTLGLMPAGLAENVLHFAVGAIALYVGYVVIESGGPSRSSRAV